MLKGLRHNLGTTKSSKLHFKSLRYRVENMIDVTKCMVEFEILPVQYITLDYKGMVAMKTCIHKTSYWVIISAVTCAS